MMSRIPRPTIPKMGRAQNGWIMLAVPSPQATAMATSPWSTPSDSAAGTMTDPARPSAPPPDGIKRLMMLDETNVQKAKVYSFENERTSRRSPRPGHAANREGHEALYPAVERVLQAMGPMAPRCR
jgi:hypothetical protein